MILKKLVGEENFAENWEKSKSRILNRRRERKRERTEMAVTNPDLFNRKKMRKQEKEKERRKRKNEEKNLSTNNEKLIKMGALEKM